MLGVVFCRFSAIEIIVFNKKKVYASLKISTPQNQILKKFNNNPLMQSFGSLKLPIWLCCGLFYALFENFIHNIESVTRFIYAWQKIPHYKIVPN